MLEYGFAEGFPFLGVGQGCFMGRPCPAHGLGSDGDAAGDDADPTASGTSEVPDHVFDEMMRFIRGALTAPKTEGTATP